MAVATGLDPNPRRGRLGEVGSHHRGGTTIRLLPAANRSAAERASRMTQLEDPIDRRACRLLALPLLIVAELVVHQRMGAVVRQFPGARSDFGQVPGEVRRRRGLGVLSVCITMADTGGSPDRWAKTENDIATRTTTPACRLESARPLLFTNL